MVTILDQIINRVIKKLAGNRQFPKSLIDKTIEEALEPDDLVVDKETKKLIYPSICKALLNREDKNVRKK